MLQCSCFSGCYVFYLCQLVLGSGEIDFEWVFVSGLGMFYVIIVNCFCGGNYNVVLVDLDEGVCMMLWIDGYQSLLIGICVQVCIVEQDGVNVVVFVFYQEG